ncbi:uncharacterized protein LOC141703685 [Apium graveolens]|uniref:uncharacterized protein LOC141703685 n=1 Tax=Apium graveolens TaxID=4045 RepID=UPI003D7BF32D
MVVHLPELLKVKMMERNQNKDVMFQCGLTPHLSGRLWQQYIVYAFTVVERYCLEWIKRNQKIIRSDLYNSICDSLRKGDSDTTCQGKNIILPATFTGSRRYMSWYFKDSLAICYSIGHPSFFLTMTYNTKWPEIQSMLQHMSGVNVADALDLVARVFKMKLDQLVDLIKNQNYFGRCTGLMYVIEFQKRGLPQAHMLIWIHLVDRPNTIEQIDDLVCAEIPHKETDPTRYNAVKNYMIHWPFGQDFSYSPCMSDGKCGPYFPKRYNGHTFFDDCGFPVYRRRMMDMIVEKNKQQLDNQFIVPYNRDLLLRFQCHVNLEICNNSRSLKYLFKYCLKGHDTATMMIRRKEGLPLNLEKGKTIDEVRHFLDGRYVCASEAAWRLLGYDIHYRYPSVERLPDHVEGGKNVTFNVNDTLEEVANKASNRKSKLEAWFVANKTIPGARDYTYQEFPRGFTWLHGQSK